MPLLLVCLVLLVYVPKFMGLSGFYVDSGSMAPAIKKGSMVYISEVSFESVNIGDVLMFESEDTVSRFTHRVIAIDAKNQLFTTKGDANNTEDPSSAAYSRCIGRVRFSVPLLGYLAKAMSSVPGIAVFGIIVIIWIAAEIEAFKSKRKRTEVSI